MSIDISKHMMDLHGKAYLPVAPRIVLMREAYPRWQVSTELVKFGEVTLVKATVHDEAGQLISTAHKTVVTFRGGDIEKAETGAIGRALSIAGFGTIQAGDMDEGEQIADSPVKVTTNGKPAVTEPSWEKATFKQFTDYCVKTISRYDSPHAVKGAMKVLGIETWVAVGDNLGASRAALYADLKKYASFRDAGMDQTRSLEALTDDLMKATP